MVPVETPRYYFQVIATALEFGSMHAILFQMALLPLTMARYSIASLSDSIVNVFVPLNRALRMHIHLGYTMIIIVFLVSLFIFAFFGFLCIDGQAMYCSRFGSEIMITGCVILAFLFLIGATSYFRHRMRYELFYAVHHLVFVMYFITIAHTIDIQQRKGMMARSQTWKWFTSTVLFYVCDRMALRLNRSYSTKLVKSSTMLIDNDEKMIVLRMKRPVLFQSKPGQYAFLKIDSIDNKWHPFSIASDPDSETIEFFIEVFKSKSWTGKLWNLLVAHQHNRNDSDNDKVEDDEYSSSAALHHLDIDIMGPYGTSLVNMNNFSHVFAIGAGTGKSFLNFSFSFLEVTF